MARRLFALSALLIFSMSLGVAQTPVSAPMKVGGDVLPPKVIHAVEPKYPHPLFHRSKSSVVLVGLIVAADGVPTDVHIVRSGGPTFDKSAMNAVQQYRFQPSTLNDKPVPVALNVEVNFKIF